MPQKRKRHSAKFKFDVAMEAAKGQETVNRIAAKYEIHPSQVSQWKRQLLDEGTEVFSTANERKQREQEALQTDLYEQIGRGTLWVQDGSGVAEKKSYLRRLSTNVP